MNFFNLGLSPRDARAVKGGRLKICCESFVGSNPTSGILFFLLNYID